MTNFMKITFYLRASIVNPDYGTIYVRIHINADRFTFGAVSVVSGLKLPKIIPVLATNWEKNKQRVNQADVHAGIVNQAIATCEEKLRKVYAQHEGFDIPMTINGVRAAVCKGEKVRPSMPDLIQKFLAEKVLLNVKASTIETYRWKAHTITDFLKHEGITSKAAEEFTPGTLKRYRTYMITHRKNQSRSADKACQVVKTILLWASENEYIRTNPLLYIRVRVDKTPNLECLTQDELALVRDAKLTPALRVAADCLDFACHTGLAYQDMKAITPSSVQVVEGKHCIVGKRMKTGTEFCIPISARIWALMDKYKGIVMPLPKLDDYNLLLRQVMLTLDINKHITSHTARKTFADWCINELDMSEEATIVAMGQKAAKELTPYRKTRPKRLLSEFPADLLLPPTIKEAPTRLKSNPFSNIYKAS